VPWELDSLLVESVAAAVAAGRKDPVELRRTTAWEGTLLAVEEEESLRRLGTAAEEVAGRLGIGREEEERQQRSRIGPEEEEERCILRRRERREEERLLGEEVDVVGDEEVSSSWLVEVGTAVAAGVVADEVAPVVDAAAPAAAVDDGTSLPSRRERRFRLVRGKVRSTVVGLELATAVLEGCDSTSRRELGKVDVEGCVAVGKELERVDEEEVAAIGFRRELAKEIAQEERKAEDWDFDLLLRFRRILLEREMDSSLSLLLEEVEPTLQPEKSSTSSTTSSSSSSARSSRLGTLADTSRARHQRGEEREVEREVA